jgi:hypothetical protein
MYSYKYKFIIEVPCAGRVISEERFFNSSVSHISPLAERSAAFCVMLKYSGFPIAYLKIN